MDTNPNNNSLIASDEIEIIKNVKRKYTKKKSNDIGPNIFDQPTESKVAIRPFFLPIKTIPEIEVKDTTAYKLLDFFATQVKATTSYILYKKETNFFFIYFDKSTDALDCCYLNQNRIIKNNELRLLLDESLVHNSSLTNTPVQIPTLTAVSLITVCNEIFSLTDTFRCKDNELLKCLDFTVAFKESFYYSLQNKALAYIVTPLNSENFNFYYFSKEKSGLLFDYSNCFFNSDYQDLENITIAFNPYLILNESYSLNTYYFCVSQSFDLFLVSNVFYQNLKHDTSPKLLNFKLEKSTDDLKLAFDLSILLISLFTKYSINLRMLSDKWILNFSLTKDDEPEILESFFNNLDEHFSSLFEANSYCKKEMWATHSFNTHTIFEGQRNIHAISSTYKFETIQILLDNLLYFFKIPFQIKLT